MTSNLSKEWANAKDLCNKLPDKSVRVCNAMHPPFTHSQCCIATRDAFLRVLSGALLYCIALLLVVVCQAIVRSIQLTGPEACWHKALTAILCCARSACSPRTMNSSTGPTFVPPKIVTDILWPCSLWTMNGFTGPEHAFVLQKTLTNDTLCTLYNVHVLHERYCVHVHHKPSISLWTYICALRHSYPVHNLSGPGPSL